LHKEVTRCRDRRNGKKEREREGRRRGGSE